MTFVLKAGGSYIITTSGQARRVTNGEYAVHRCTAKPQAEGLRPTMGFRLD